jgi:hypothetical protein
VALDGWCVISTIHSKNDLIANFTDDMVIIVGYKNTMENQNG